MFATRTAIPRQAATPSLLRPNPVSQAPRHIRGAHYRLNYGRPRPQYNRFSRARQLYGLWRTSPAFRTGVGATGVGAGGFYVYNLEHVPVRLSLPLLPFPPPPPQPTNSSSFPEAESECPRLNN